MRGVGLQRIDSILHALVEEELTGVRYVTGIAIVGSRVVLTADMHLQSCVSTCPLCMCNRAYFDVDMSGAADVETGEHGVDY